jgi:hypothetical protein
MAGRLRQARFCRKIFTSYELTVRLKEDTEDDVLQQLHNAMKTLREKCESTISITYASLDNIMLSEPMRHKTARERGLKLFKSASRGIDAAIGFANNQMAILQKTIAGPPAPRDDATRAAHREIRDALRAMPPEKAVVIVDDAVQRGEEGDPVVGAALTAPAPWLVGMSRSQLEMARGVWAQRHHADDIARLRRRKLAVDAAVRASKIAEQFIGALTDANMIRRAEEAEKRAEMVMRATERTVSTSIN